MKKALCLILLAILSLVTLTSCDDANTIRVGASPSPHAQILNSKAVQDYVKSKGYTLKVVIYNDYVTPNKALNDKGIDANYFQHIPYLNEEVENYGYGISVACEVHNEPLNLYGKTKKATWDNTKVYIINDKTNVARAFELLKVNGLISSYDVTNFNAENPVYTSEIGVTIECIESGLLHYKVEEGGYAVIPGNYALTAWNTQKITEYKIFGESTSVALPNIIAVRTEDLGSEKTKILVEALSQPEVQAYIESTFGATVNYLFKSHLTQE